MENNFKEQFIQIFKQNIIREGADKLLEWLESTDFFTAPASIKFHSSYEGGLVEHSINVYNRFKKLIINEYGTNYTEKITDESIAVIGLLHDICKAEYYETEMRNVKEDGQWVQKPFYTVNDKLPYGHGEKSVYIISGFMRLTRAEAMAINWHMGGFDSRVKGGGYGLSEAFYEYPICVLLHISDLSATYLDEAKAE